MATLQGILRVLRDLGIVAVAVLVLWKVVISEDDAGGPAPAAPRVRRLPVTTNSLGMALVQLPAGELALGSGWKNSEDGSGTARFASDLWIGRHEVTQAEYRQVMQAAPSAFPGDRRPVEQVSWAEAVEFCRRLGAREGKTYRLPTEAEWEYACRAGSAAGFSFGDDDGRLGEFAWYDANAGRRTHPVGSRKPNAWGLHDMHGNVWEWCADPFREDFPSSGPGEDASGPAVGEFRVLRGGCWFNRPLFCRSGRPDFGRAEDREDSIGFRVVLEAVGAGR